MNTSKTIIAGIAVLTVLLTGSSLIADTVTFQEGVSNSVTGVYAGTEDNDLRSDYPDGNTGGNGAFGTIGGSGTNSNSIIRFDLSGLSGKTITSATLSLYAYSVSGNQAVNLYEVAAANKDWVEGTSGWPPVAQAGSSCWNYREYDATTPTDWAGSAGCSTSGTDYVADRLAQTWVLNTVQFYSWDITRTTMLQSWVDSPSDNAGLLISAGGSARSSFYTSEHGTVSLRPMLEITYTPEPATMALLSLGGIGVLLRRRRRS
ncbi:MAG: DNRLRE domain-containing protein [Phycisphaerae bacterium]|nr:DNRLRE domain-containing protein [Phycisphaerae bacterium]